MIALIGCTCAAFFLGLIIGVLATIKAVSEVLEDEKEIE